MILSKAPKLCNVTAHHLNGDPRAEPERIYEDLALVQIRQLGDPIGYVDEEK